LSSSSKGELQASTAIKIMAIAKRHRIFMVLPPCLYPVYNG
jgi:hypothetical protein